MIEILSIEAIKEGDIITRVCPANGYSGDSSHVGQKMELIKLTKTKIILKSFEDEDNREIHLSLKDWKFGWRQYELSGDKKYKISPYSERRGQLRVQYVYLGIELDKLRGHDPDDKFGDYLTVCRYLEGIGCSC
jgi:hypothetical protein